MLLGSLLRCNDIVSALAVLRHAHGEQTIDALRQPLVQTREEVMQVRERVKQAHEAIAKHLEEVRMSKLALLSTF